MKKLVMSFLMVVVGLAFSHTVRAQSLDTSFTYQGKLIDTSNPAQGFYDFEFKLFDDPNTDGQVGSTLAQENIGVYEGYFTVVLDFGGGVFDGTALWLEIGVRAGELEDPNVYTTLTPRQKITASPYALYAVSDTKPFQEIDIVLGSIPYDNNPAYTVGIGLVKDISSEIPTGFTLIDVTAKGRKAHQMTGEFQDEPPLILYPTHP